MQSLSLGISNSQYLIDKKMYNTSTGRFIHATLSDTEMGLICFPSNINIGNTEQIYNYGTVPVYSSLF